MSATKRSRRRGEESSPQNGAAGVVAPSGVEPAQGVELLKTFQSHIDDMRTLIQCKICFRPLYEPYTLSCGHTYCYSCLCEWFKSDAEPHRRKSCPDCRASVRVRPSPNYLLRDIIHMFVGRTELLAEGDTVQEHEQAKQKEAEIVEKDRNGPTYEAGLFKGAFKQLFGPPALHLLRDPEDQVERCPDCSWEWEGGHVCGHCGYELDVDEFSDEDDYTTLDSNAYDSDGNPYDDGFYGEMMEEEMDFEGGPLPPPEVEPSHRPQDNDHERYLDSDEDDAQTVTSAEGPYVHHDYHDHTHAYYNADGGISVNGNSSEDSDEEDMGSMVDFISDDEGTINTEDSISSFRRDAIIAGEYTSDYDTPDADHEEEDQVRHSYPYADDGPDAAPSSASDNEPLSDDEPIRHPPARRAQRPNNPTDNSTSRTYPQNTSHVHWSNGASSSHQRDDRHHDRSDTRRGRHQRIIVDSSSEPEPSEPESQASVSASAQEITPPQSTSARLNRQQQHRSRRQSKRRGRSRS